MDTSLIPFPQETKKYAAISGGRMKGYVRELTAISRNYRDAGHQYSLVDGNSRIGRSPGDPESTDPDALIVQPYTSTEASGGFLHVTVSPGVRPTATFRFYDERGVLLHTVEKVAR